MPPSDDKPNQLRDPDRFYRSLVELHEGFDTEASMLFNAKLILLMAQQIGDDALLHRLLRVAAAGIAGDEIDH
jgi:hypothetical protein